MWPVRIKKPLWLIWPVYRADTKQAAEISLDEMEAK